MSSLDINCDMAEGFGIYSFGQDREIISLISSANIACGFHAGGPEQMHEAVNLCLKHDVAIGAHPGYYDLQGFGRRRIVCSFSEIKNMIIYQVGALKAIAGSLGGRVEYIKPHGALYNTAAVDDITASAVIEAAIGLGGLPLMVPDASLITKMAEERGIIVIREGFADRNYNNAGTLVSRDNANAIISSPAVAAAQVIMMVREGKVNSVDGHKMNLSVDSVCVHGDNPGVIAVLNEIRKVLAENNISVVKALKALGGRNVCS
ncbi:5-oxoprolinase subunit PxpA [Phosphitispora sp. TUW77]|uniref:5-oxoprolinase subunit PxpA n=1 Tax=Phosphitispora sp. TUW77 TaxID=3152361 RepID=UPI003AB87B32